ncbi:HPr family phosphocarrier protein [Elioraea thermophila]|uniref:HPr family phosphocarrier protein n=1 Tax=Elioraea thermophila TaxID=2185104 RepID=UPI000DF16F30
MNEWPNAGGEDAPQDPNDPFPTLADAPCSGPVLTRSLTIRNKRGLHARAAAKFVKLAEQFSACVTVRKNGAAVSARSIMGLMMLGAGQGAEILLEAEGWDAREALDALAGLVEAGFHEE